MSSSTPLTLSDVKEKFALWRATRGSKRQKIPDTLWDSIYQIAPHHKTTVIARELRLNLTDVKNISIPIFLFIHLKKQPILLTCPILLLKHSRLIF